MAWNGSDRNRQNVPGQAGRETGRLGTPASFSPRRRLTLAGLAIAIVGLAVWYCLSLSDTPPSPAAAPAADSAPSTSAPANASPDLAPAPDAQSATRPAPANPIDKPQTTDTSAPAADRPAATTNSTAATPPEDRRLFKNPMDQLLAMVTPAHPGDDVPPLPIVDDMQFTAAQEQAILERLTADDDDSDERLERKGIVQSLRDEYQELKKRGWSFIDYVKALDAKARLDAEVLQESVKIHETVFNDPAVTDAEYLKTLGEINRVLAERGIKPIEPPKDGGDGEPEGDGEAKPADNSH